MEYFYFRSFSNYCCLVQNSLNITSPETAQIDSVDGSHILNRTKNDEVIFWSDGKIINYFPRGLEKFFKFLTGILVISCHLKEIYAEDLKEYTNLTYLDINDNDIEVLEENLFYYNGKLEAISMHNNKLIHIAPSILDNLDNLVSFYNIECIGIGANNNRSAVIEVVKAIKRNCSNLEYSRLYKSIKSQVHIIQDQQIVDIINLKSKDSPISILASEAAKHFYALEKTHQVFSSNANMVIMILMVVTVSFIQTIILSVIFKQFFLNSC